MSWSRPARDVAVIGGGWAGMAAAVTLAAAGIPVTVFEAAQTLGGRARRVVLDGALLDNGQHLLLGAYRTTLELIRQVRPDDGANRVLARMPLSLVGPGPFRLRVARLPSPLHAFVGLLSARGCTLTERLAVLRAFAGWKRAGWRAAPAATVARLLEGQPASMAARLWTPLCLAALNTPPAAASAQVFLNVLRDALAAERAASDLIIPAADLSALFPDAAALYVERHGGVVRRGMRIRRLTARAGMVTLESAGAPRNFRDVILAAAPWQTSALLGALPFAAGVVAQIDRYTYQPITTVYLRYAQPVPVAFPMQQIDRGPGHWVFDRSTPGADDALLALVISADGPHRRLGPTELVAALAGQLRDHLPALKSGATPVWSRIITERRATHASTPERAHPPAGHLGSGVYLAGDHTDPDYPATLEAAARSGVRAAHAVLEQR